MPDFFVSLFMNIAIVSCLLFGLSQFKLCKFNVRWAGVFLTLVTLYFFALFYGKYFIPLREYIPGLQWNWSGKLSAIILWVLTLIVLIRCKLGFALNQAGFTLKQAKGSVIPALIVISFSILFHIFMRIIIGDGPEYDYEELAYQALMPGLDEEPMFRGVLLYILSLAIISGRINTFGAEINIAGVAIVILFGLLHGLSYSDGGVAFSALNTLLTGFYGFIFLWLRERTGSLLMPIFSHNAINLIGQFF